jgi:hypothetical protein
MHQSIYGKKYLLGKDFWTYFEKKSRLIKN